MRAFSLQQALLFNVKIPSVAADNIGRSMFMITRTHQRASGRSREHQYLTREPTDKSCCVLTNASLDPCCAAKEGCLSIRRVAREGALEEKSFFFVVGKEGFFFFSMTSTRHLVPVGNWQCNGRFIRASSSNCGTDGRMWRWRLGG